MPNTALITGASSGIGAEFARYHALLGGDLIITARNMDALSALKAELEAAHGVTVSTIACDLGAPDGAEKIYQATKGTRIDILINNAGFGGHGKFIERPLLDDLGMIDLNVKALVSLCHKIGSDMAANGGGKILNVSSTASYMPGPLQATYFATKAFVSSFSAALHEELRDKGVSVTALEPGYVETAFADRADLRGTALTKSGATAASVAKCGYDAMLAGKISVINDWKLGFQLRWLMPFLPLGPKMKFIRKMQEKS